MKKPARRLSLLLFLLIFFCLGSTPAFAASYEHCAEALQELGLFAGTEQGYALEEAPNRAQAAVMLVRLLGREAEALANPASHPFTDVPHWAAAQVGYLYQQGLTRGISATGFGAQQPCDAHMYAVFILRALGYRETAGDFRYAEALAFAQERGLLALPEGQPFLRDQLAAFSYNALALPLKDQETLLLEQLLAEEAVPPAAADKYLARFTAFTHFQARQAAAEQNAISGVLSSETNITIAGASAQMTMQGQAALIFDPQTPARTALAMQLTMRAAGEDIPADLQEEAMRLHLHQGNLYYDGAGLKFKLALTEAEQAELFAMADLAALAGLPDQQALYHICQVQSASETISKNGVNYQIAFAPAAAAATAAAFLTTLPELGLLPQELASALAPLLLTASYDAAGQPRSLSYQLELAEDDLALQMSLTLEDIKSGDEVTVEPPPNEKSYPDYQDWLEEYLDAMPI